MTDDGFVTIGSRAQMANRDTARFYRNPKMARVPLPDGWQEGLWAEWQYNNAGMLRVRFHTSSGRGFYKVTRGGYRSSMGQITTGALWSGLGVELVGAFPVTKIEGTDVYIDISGALEEDQP